MEIATLSSKGQLTIPKDIREEYGFTAGDRILFERVKEGMLIRKNVKDFMDYEGFLKGVRPMPEQEAAEAIISHIMGDE